MKVLHTALQRSGSPGIVKQMRWELEEAITLDLPWETKIFLLDMVSENEHPLEWLGLSASRVDNRKPIRRLINWCRYNLEYYRKLERRRNDETVLLVRYAVGNPFQLLFLLRCRLARYPVFLVHHTLEGKELGAERDWSRRVLWLAELILGPMAVASAYGTIAVTKEVGAYEVKRAFLNRTPLIYPNGIAYNCCDLIEEKGDVPEILFLASYFYPWHGLDRLLDSLAGTDKQFSLHLVGQLSEQDCKLASLDSRVVVHGQLSGQKIELLAQSCWVGLSSFALDRKGMTEACTLKVREYLMLGIPVYANHKDIFEESFEYYKQGEADMHEILSFAECMRHVPRQIVSLKAKPYIDKGLLTKKLYHSIQEIFERY